MDAEEVPVVQLGKNGLTERALAHIGKIMRQRGVVRVKLLRSFLGETTAEQAHALLKEKTGARTASKIGFVITLVK